METVHVALEYFQKGSMVSRVNELLSTVKMVNTSLI